MAMSPNQGAGRGSRRTLLAVVGAALVIAVVVIAALVLLRGGSSADTTQHVDLEGIPQEGAFLGSPDATVTLIEYADIQCPGCLHYTETLFPTLVEEYVRPGNVRTEFRGFPFIGEDSMKGQRFLLAAAEQNKLWELMQAFYANQGVEHSGWLTDDLIREVAAALPGLDVDKLFADAESEKITQAAQQSLVDAQQAGISQTPSLLVRVGDGKPYLIEVATPDQLREALDGAL
jgi:protein-disulfide isomerase